MNNIGYAFAPMGQQQQQQGGQSNRASLSPQQAVKFLSLRIPERVGPNALAPQSLLSAQGGAGSSLGSLGAILRALIAGQGGQQGLGQGQQTASMSVPGLNPGAPPPPRIRPGTEAPTPGESPMLPDRNLTSWNNPVPDNWWSGLTGMAGVGPANPPTQPLF